MSTPVVITTYTSTLVAGFSPSANASAQPTTSGPAGSWDVVATISGPLGTDHQVSNVVDRPAAVALLVERLGTTN